MTRSHHILAPESPPPAGPDRDEAYQTDPDFIAEGLAIAVTEQALRLMRDRGVTQAHLAENMGVSRGYVSRIFSAPPNLTLRSVAQLAVALGTRPRISILPDNEPDM